MNTTLDNGMILSTLNISSRGFALASPDSLVRLVCSRKPLESAAEDDSMGDSAGPMFVQHTEAMLDEIDRMVRIETLLFCLDTKDPLCVVEYIDDLYTHYRAAEVSVCVPPNYMAQQVHINDRMRGFLVDRLIIEELTKHNIMIASKVHYRFKLMEETLYLTVSLIDRLLAVHSVAKKNLQLEEFLQETLMLNTVQFKLSVPTPYVFIKRFLKASQSDREFDSLARYVLSFHDLTHPLGFSVLVSTPTCV
ncbi:Cyclin-B2-3, partial [Cucurbita argyrosperma subsp. argyrosperma]